MEDQSYREGSAYEHSDPTSLNIYKEPLGDSVNNVGLYTLNLSKTDIQLEEMEFLTGIAQKRKLFITNIN